MIKGLPNCTGHIGANQCKPFLEAFNSLFKWFVSHPISLVRAYLRRKAADLARKAFIGKRVMSAVLLHRGSPGAVDVCPNNSSGARIRCWSFHTSEVVESDCSGSLSVNLKVTSRPRIGVCVWVSKLRNGEEGCRFQQLNQVAMRKLGTGEAVPSNGGLQLGKEGSLLPYVDDLSTIEIPTPVGWRRPPNTQLQPAKQATNTERVLLTSRKKALSKTETATTIA